MKGHVGISKLKKNTQTRLGWYLSKKLELMTSIYQSYMTIDE